MTVPTTTDPFVTADQIAISDTDAVDGASGFIRELCGWHIWPNVPATVTLRAPGGAVLMLPTLQLTAITSVTVKRDTTCDPETVDLSLLQIYPNGVIERLDRCVWPSRGTVTIAFSHGYAEVPAVIKAVCQSLAKRWPQSASPWNTRKMGSATLSMGAGAGALQPGSLTVVEQMVIDRYTLRPQP